MNLKHEYEELTYSEKYLTHLCKNTFLNLWSWPHVYRNQRWNGGEGKEVCDLLVVFDNNIIIFSDKYCKFPDTGDLTLDWCRWFRRTVYKSANQIWGAERWIHKHSDRLYVDKDCKTPFPVPLPNPDQAIFHRIVVAHGCSKRCQYSLGGTGSLMINPNIIGNEHYDVNSGMVMPFTVGRLSKKNGFVHVLDDFTLNIVLQTVDTITDFTNYLTKKENFFESGKLGMAAGEEDLLASYFYEMNEAGEHDFRYPKDADLIMLEDGFWNDYKNHPDRLAQIEADKISYAWDRLIDKFSKHVIDNTLYSSSNHELSDIEMGLRILARESRTRRRMLAKNLLAIMERAETEIRSVRVVAGTVDPEPYYVFLSLDRREDISLDEYRIVRSNLLTNYCLAAAAKFPGAEKIVGIATEPMRYKSRSEDLQYIDTRKWTKKDQEEAEKVRQEYNLLAKTKMHEYVEDEFPRRRMRKLHKGRNRNKPCFCGSGKKYKKCCGKLQ